MNHSSSTSGQKLETHCGSTRHLLLRRLSMGSSAGGRLLVHSRPALKSSLTISPRFFHSPSGSISEIRAGMSLTPSYPPSSKICHSCVARQTPKAWTITLWQQLLFLNIETRTAGAGIILVQHADASNCTPVCVFVWGAEAHLSLSPWPSAWGEMDLLLIKEFFVPVPGQGLKDPQSAWYGPSQRWVQNQTLMMESWFVAHRPMIAEHGYFFWPWLRVPGNCGVAPLWNVTRQECWELGSAHRCSLPGTSVWTLISLQACFSCVGYFLLSSWYCRVLHLHPVPGCSPSTQCPSSESKTRKGKGGNGSRNVCLNRHT